MCLKKMSFDVLNYLEKPKVGFIFRFTINFYSFFNSSFVVGSPSTPSVFWGFFAKKRTATLSSHRLNV
jgi:hypothetical protein